nr:DUF1642 domain-containing protein [Streptococcus lutetiensis]DAJ20679.1 MAG TPA: Protein of unknown function (DUF1642) [Siphoviridae sp. ctWYg3]
MNKQEFQKTIQNMEPPKHFSALTFKEAFNEGFNSAINNVLFNSCFLDTPEKPVVPQFVADFYESIKDDFEDKVYELCLQFNNDNELSREVWEWFDCRKNEPIQTLVKMKLYGYEVEKEKLYTVKFSNEDFGKIYIGIFKKVNKLGISSLPLNDNNVKSWFTEDELKRFKFWDNPAFEVREVEG